MGIIAFVCIRYYNQQTEIIQQQVVVILRQSIIVIVLLPERQGAWWWLPWVTLMSHEGQQVIVLVFLVFSSLIIVNL